MKIAVVGIGDVGKTFLEELRKSRTHDTVAITRVAKDFPTSLGIEQRISDYTVDSLATHLADCDAVVSTVSAPGKTYVAVHAALLQACQRSPRCKRFIHSEWTINAEDFPDQPLYHAQARPAVRDLLRAQNDVKWTVICNYWFMDYLLPSTQRHLQDIGVGWMMNHADKTFEMYGDGLEEISLTSVRDTALAAIALLEWEDFGREEFTHFAAQTLSYRELYDTMKKRDGSWKLKPVTLTEAVRSIFDSETAGKGAEAEALRLMGFTRCNQIPANRGLTFGVGPLANVKGRAIEDFLREAERDGQLPS